jgi:hypothetical protein
VSFHDERGIIGVVSFHARGILWCGQVPNEEVPFLMRWRGQVPNEEVPFDFGSGRFLSVILVVADSDR